MNSVPSSSIKVKCTHKSRSKLRESACHVSGRFEAAPDESPSPSEVVMGVQARARVNYYDLLTHLNTQYRVSPSALRHRFRVAITEILPRLPDSVSAGGNLAGWAW